MPTMAKLISMIMLAALGYVAADLVGGHLPPEQRQSALRWLTAVFGALIGWQFLGAKVRGEWAHSVGLGASSVALLVLTALMWFSGYEMIRRAMRLAYGGDPFAGLQDMIEIAIDNLQYLAHPDVLVVLVLGSVGVGGVATAVSRVWP